MAQILVRRLDDEVKAWLQCRARRHGRSTEDGVRPPLGSRLAARFARVGFTQEEILDLRDQPHRPADFES